MVIRSGLHCTIMYKTMHIRVHNKGIVSKVLCIYVHYIGDTTPAGREGAAGQTDTLVSLTYFFKNFQTYFRAYFQTVQALYK